jgi:Zn-dependent protease with chaperone function
MAEQEIKKAKLMHGQMLNQYGISELSNLDIYRKLVLALTESDLETLKENKIFFNPLFSPASQSDLSIDLERGSKIITVDINSLKLFTSDESVAIILHEIGHALNPELKGEDGEFAADDYAVAHNYRESLISALERGKSIRPSEFSKLITEKRIKRLREQQP